jgi:hypothetical protein
MAFEDLLKKQRAEIIERGYSNADMEKIREKIEEERRQWKRRFESHVDSMMAHADVMPARDLVRYAREVADLEISIAEEREE